LWTDLIGGGEQQTLPFELRCFRPDGADVEREVTVTILNVPKKTLIFLFYNGIKRCSHNVEMQYISYRHPGTEYVNPERGREIAYYSN
jgi:hypothetical protein